jgi:hypothetical protein
MDRRGSAMRSYRAASSDQDHGAVKDKTQVRNKLRSCIRNPLHLLHLALRQKSVKSGPAPGTSLVHDQVWDTLAAGYLLYTSNDHSILGPFTSNSTASKDHYGRPGSHHRSHRKGHGRREPVVLQHTVDGEVDIDDKHLKASGHDARGGGMQEPA